MSAWKEGHLYTKNVDIQKERHCVQLQLEFAIKIQIRVSNLGTIFSGEIILHVLCVQHTDTNVCTMYI